MATAWPRWISELARGMDLYQTLGRTVTTSASVGNRKGYAGYENDGSIWRIDHVRNRTRHIEFGRWMQRDKLGYVDGMSLYEYVQSKPLTSVDPSGMLLVRHAWPYPGACKYWNPNDYDACTACCLELGQLIDKKWCDPIKDWGKQGECQKRVKDWIGLCGKACEVQP